MAKEFKDQSGVSAFKQFEFMWRNSGKCMDGDNISMKDALATPEAAYFIPRVITNAIQEAVEPLLIGPRLLQRLQFQPGTFIQLPIMGALDGDFDMAEEEEYPELRVTLGPGSQITAVGKVGVAVKFSEEILRYSNFDVITMHTSQAGKALARFKEMKIFNTITSVGTRTHSNTAPATSTFGVTRGRQLDGAANGSVTMDDLFECYSAILANGFVPDMLLLHPLTWLMFVQDPVLRAFALQNGGGAFFQGWQGSPAHQDFPPEFGGQGMAGGGYVVPPQAGVEAPSALTAWSQNLTSAPEIPGYFGFPMKIVVSPFIPFTPATNRTNIIMCDSAELGYLVVDHDLLVDEWTNPSNDILKVKMKERYTVAIKNEGLGIGVMEDIVVTPNEIVLPAQTTIDVAGAVAPIVRNVAV